MVQKFKEIAYKANGPGKALPWTKAGFEPCFLSRGGSFQCLNGNSRSVIFFFENGNFNNGKHRLSITIDALFWKFQYKIFRPNLQQFWQQKTKLDQGESQIVVMKVVPDDSMTFFRKTFDRKTFGRGHLPGKHLPGDTFARRAFDRRYICPKDICPE
jgi:hypothetical protein